MNLAKRFRRCVGNSTPRHPGAAVRLIELPEETFDFSHPSVERFFAVVRVALPVAVSVAAFAEEGARSTR